MSGPRPVDPSRSDDEAAWQDLVRRFHESEPATRERGDGPHDDRRRDDLDHDRDRDDPTREITDDEDTRPDGHLPDDPGRDGTLGPGGTSIPDHTSTGGTAADDGTDTPPTPRRDAAGPGLGRPQPGHPGGDDAPTGANTFVWRALPGVGPGQGTGSGPRDHVVDEPEEDFEPPEPAPLSSAEPALALAWSGVVASLALLVMITVFIRPAPTLIAWALGGLFVVSAGYLAYRLPRDRHDGDDGAQV